MKNYYFGIYAIVDGKASICLHRKEYQGKEANEILSNQYPIISLIDEFMSVFHFDWGLDDGTDNEDTPYCQYVCCPEKGNKKSYILATWQEYVVK